MGRSSKQIEYGRLLVVANDEPITNFKFTKKPTVTLAKIVDELTSLHYNFGVRDRITRRTTIYEGREQNGKQERNVYTSYGNSENEVYGGMLEEERKRSVGRKVDVLLIQASTKRAFVHQIDGMDDFDEYCQMLDESDSRPVPELSPCRPLRGLSKSYSFS